MLRRWLRSKFFAGRRVNISSGVPSVLLESSPIPAFLSAEAEGAARQHEADAKNKMVCFTCGNPGHKKANCPTMTAKKAPAEASADADADAADVAASAAAAAAATSAVPAASEAERRPPAAAEETDLRNSTMALWDMPYDLQIAAKSACLLQSLGAVTTAFLNQVFAYIVPPPHPPPPPSSSAFF